MKSKTRKLAYWVATAIAVIGVGGTGLLDLTGAASMAQHVSSLGYPTYLQHFLGIAKVLGAVVIVLPAMARLKEWAYAGMTFDLVGAAYSHVANGDAADELLLPMVLLVLILVSYFLRAGPRRLPSNGATAWASNA